MNGDAKKVGRPAKYRSKRTTTTIRMTPEMRAIIERRSIAAGRSMSDEVELILEKVFFPLVKLDDAA